MGAVIADSPVVPNIPPKPRNQDIDVLRGLSILWVLALHAAMFGVPDLGWLGSSILENGYYGVTIFFVVSGYLITSTSLARSGRFGALSPTAFYSRRIARIMPCLCLLIVVLLSLHGFGVTPFAFDPDRSPVQATIYALTFRYNYYYWMFASQADQPWRPLWSLAIEEWFYVAFPIVCIVVRRRSILAAVAIAMILYGPFAREDSTLLYYLTGCADALALGCLTAIVLDSSVVQRRRRRWFADALKLLGLVVIAGSCFLGNVTVNFRIGPSIVAFGAALFVLGARPGSHGTIVDAMTAPIRRFGERSYEIYLFHITVLILFVPFVRGIVGPSSHLVLPLVLLAIFITGNLIGTLYADPADRWIRKLLISKRA